MKKSIIGICGGILFIFILIVIVSFALSNNITTINNDNGFNDTTTLNNHDDFKGNNAKVENVTVSDKNSFDMHGKIMFKNDESYACLNAEVNLKNGSTIPESIVKNWTNVKKNKWYTFDIMLKSMIGQDYSISDISSIDFKYDNVIIYTIK